jgi:hypothetical protein
MQTRRNFCKCCLGVVLVGMGSPLAFGSENRAEGMKENDLLAYCGINCSKCDAYIATQKNDDTLRAETAKKWSEEYKIEMKPEGVNCDGCTSNSGRIVNYCAICEIRKCAWEKKLKTCASCPEYSCEKLDKFLSQNDEARKILENLRK